MHVLKLELRRFEFPPVITTEMFLNCIATRVGGYTYVCRSDKTLGVTVAGTVVGLMFNMTQPIYLDKGHCAYICPGSLETPTRAGRSVARM